METPSGRAGDRQGEETSASVLLLGGLVAVLAVVASATGLLSSAGPGGRAVATVRGATAHLYGVGLYRFDSVFSGSGQRGTDLVTLVLGVPLLVACLVLYRRNSLRARLLLAGTFSYFLYVYSSLALGYAFNGMFLVYVALFGASLYGLILLLRTIDLDSLPAATLERLPTKGPAAFLFFSGVIVLVAWLQPVIAALVDHGVPTRTEGYTTATTYALDLAVITPALFTAGWLVLRRRPIGYVMSFPLLGIILLLGPAIAAQTVSQTRAGIDLTPGEAIGPVAGFLLVCAWAIWVIVSVLGRLPGGNDRSGTALPRDAQTPT